MNIRPNWRRSFGLVTFDPDPWEMTLAANRVQDHSYEKWGLIPRKIRGYSYEFWGHHPPRDSDSDSDDSRVGGQSPKRIRTISLDEWSLDPGDGCY